MQTRAASPGPSQSPKTSHACISYTGNRALTPVSSGMQTVFIVKEKHCHLTNLYLVWFVSRSSVRGKLRDKNVKMSEGILEYDLHDSRV